MPKKNRFVTVSLAHARRIAKNAPRTHVPDSQIDFSDIPASTPAQLEAMVRDRRQRLGRVGRPPLGRSKRKLIALRVDQVVLARWRKEARRRHIGYQTLIHELLVTHAPGVEQT